MKQKKKINNYFFEFILFIISFLLGFFRAFKLFFLGKTKTKNIFNDFLDFIFRRWPKYFWEKPTLYKFFSLPGNILNYIFKK